MQFTTIAAPTSGHRSIRNDLLLALVLATTLTIAWAIKDWARLSHFVLPDPDDMMRLAQVRDWLAGQAFNDWTQHRMDPPTGGAMHWSRINDFGIAALILAATPLAGRHGAELVAVLCYPALLLVADLFLSARIARRLWSPEAGPVGAVLAALAYPGQTLFVPGRIDHHALQTVLIVATILWLMRAGSWRAGAVAGLLCAISLTVGLETAPQVAALVGVVFLLWAAGRAGERARLAGFAATLAGVTALFLATMRPTFWSPAFCDAFTPASSTGTLAVAAALGALAAATPLFSTWRQRVAAGVALGGAAIGISLLSYPACLSGPYGVVDPFLQRWFLPNIEEANGILRQPSVSRMVSLGGLLATACAASVWMMIGRPRRWPTMAPVVAVVAMSALVTLAQVRGTYIGAPAAAPVLAGLIVAARRRRSWRMPAIVGAWLASTGTAYAEVPAIASWLLPARVARPSPTRPSDICKTGDVWEQLDRFPQGVVMTSTIMAAYVIGATRHATVGAGYHRQNSGNMAVYRYFLGSRAQAAAIARQRHVRYVLFCPGDFSEMGLASRYPNGIAARLEADRPPAGFEQLRLRGSALRFYRIAH